MLNGIFQRVEKLVLVMLFARSRQIKQLWVTKAKKMDILLKSYKVMELKLKSVDSLESW